MYSLVEAALLVLLTVGTPPAGKHSSFHVGLKGPAACLLVLHCAAMHRAAQKDYGQTCTQTGYMHLCAKYCVPSTLYSAMQGHALPELDMSADHLCSCGHTWTCFWPHDDGSALALQEELRINELIV